MNLARDLLAFLLIALGLIAVSTPPLYDLIWSLI